MRISDWSSDVCSSDLYTYTYATLGEFLAWTIGWDLILELLTAAAVIAKYWGIYLATVFELFDVPIPTTVGVFGLAMDWGPLPIVRSEERRVGQEGVRRCRSRWSP